MQYSNYLMWFILAVIIFSIVYFIYSRFSNKGATKSKLCSTGLIAMIVGGVSLLILKLFSKDDNFKNVEKREKERDEKIKKLQDREYELKVENENLSEDNKNLKDQLTDNESKFNEELIKINTDYTEKENKITSDFITEHEKIKQEKLDNDSSVNQSSFSVQEDVDIIEEIVKKTLGK